MKLIITTEPTYQEVTAMQLIRILLRALFKPNIKCYYCGHYKCDHIHGDTYKCRKCKQCFLDGDVL